MGKLMWKSKKGLSMIEVIVTVVILGVILTPITVMLSSWYKSFFKESDIEMVQMRSNEVMQAIMGDLRVYGDQNSTVQDGGNTLYIKNGLTYTYSLADQKLLCSGVDVINNTNLLVIYFHVSERKPSGYDSSLIDIELKIATQKGEEVDLKNSYRKKVES